jgi:hypothetical protein
LTKRLLAQAQEMRVAIDHIEGALMALDLDELMDLFEDQRDTLVLHPPMTVGELRRVCNALKECTRIINSKEYEL